jgi:ubiquinone/menaquinone biosynthesis C-methylase UbiE
LKTQMDTNTLGYICQHTGNHIKDNIDDILNGMIRILGKHGNFNRIEFGRALWNSVLYCLIWFPSSAAHTDLLECVPPSTHLLD